MTLWWIVMMPALVSILTDARVSRSKPPTQAPIIDGTYAGDYEFPYIVAIRQEGFTFHGAGVIIDPQWILTARHVVINDFADKESFYFNFSSMQQLYVYPKFDNNISGWYSWPYHSAEKLFCAHIPSDTQVFRTDSDLALIKLADPIMLGNKSPYNLQKIKIYDGEMSIDYRDGYDVRVAGWGILGPNQTRDTQYLRKAEIPNRSRLQHSRDDQLIQYLAYRPYQQIGLYFPGHAPCSGDSGGPAVRTTVGTGEEYLFGIISWIAVTEPMCADVVFVQNLDAYRGWIRQVMSHEEDAYRIYNCDFFNGREYNVPVP